MKSLVAFLLAVLVLGSSLLPTFGVDQSTKLVELIQHYQQHREAAPELSFMEFMAMHYGENSEHQKHPNHSHHNLPAAGHTAPAFTPATVRLIASADAPVVILPNMSVFGYSNLYSFLAVSSLINPPRC